MKQAWNEMNQTKKWFLHINVPKNSFKENADDEMFHFSLFSFEVISTYCVYVYFFRVWMSSCCLFTPTCQQHWTEKLDFWVFLCEKYFNRQENELSKVIKIVLIEKKSPIKIMAGSRRSIQKLLDRHKLQIARELDPSQSAILTQLTKKGVIISEEERQILVCGSSDSFTNLEVQINEFLTNIYYVTYSWHHKMETRIPDNRGDAKPDSDP